MSIERESILDFAQAVWSTVLGVDVHEGTRAEPPQPTVRVAVYITGTWEGSVMIECSESFARWAASRMFDAEVSSRQDVGDALGELTNMVGGNLKALLPGPNRLSIPDVRHDAKAEQDPAEGDTLWLDCGGEHIVLKVCARPSVAVSV